MFGVKILILKLLRLNRKYKYAVMADSQLKIDTSQEQVPLLAIMTASFFYQVTSQQEALLRKHIISFARSGSLLSQHCTTRALLDPKRGFF